MSATFAEYLGKSPRIGADCFIAPTAVLVGDVVIGNNCSIWYGAVLRGDGGPIRVGNSCNIQENVVVHCLSGGKVNIGNEVSVGHGTVLHGCTIQDRVLIGINATILDGAVIGSDSVIAAAALVSKNKECPAGSLYAGVPAKPMSLTEEVAAMISITAARYTEYAKIYAQAKDY